MPYREETPDEASLNSPTSLCSTMTREECVVASTTAMPDGATQSPPVDDYDDDGVQDKRPYVVVSPLVVVIVCCKL
jgi:hypothetical protein